MSDLTRPVRSVTTTKKQQSGVADGIRTHDNRNHNPGLYQLSYGHRRSAAELYRRDRCSRLSIYSFDSTSRNFASTSRRSSLLARATGGKSFRISNGRHASITAREFQVVPRG